MARGELLERISIDPEICSGKPCIRGHRIRASLILDLLASGAAVEEVTTLSKGSGFALSISWTVSAFATWSKYAALLVAVRERAGALVSGLGPSGGVDRVFLRRSG